MKERKMPEDKTMTERKAMPEAKEKPEKKGGAQPLKDEDAEKVSGGVIPIVLAGELNNWW